MQIKQQMMKVAVVAVLEEVGVVVGDAGVAVEEAMARVEAVLAVVQEGKEAIVSHNSHQLANEV